MTATGYIHRFGAAIDKDKMHASNNVCSWVADMVKGGVDLKTYAASGTKCMTAYVHVKIQDTG